MNPRIKTLRIGVASCGIAAGAEAVQTRLRECAGNIPVIGVGCLGSCYAEPMVEAVVASEAALLIIALLTSYGTETPYCDAYHR